MHDDIFHKNDDKHDDFHHHHHHHDESSVPAFPAPWHLWSLSFPKEFSTGRQAPQQGLPALSAAEDAAAAQLLQQHLAAEGAAETKAALLELPQIHGTFSGRWMVYLLY
jgi:hypothetical protein